MAGLHALGDLNDDLGFATARIKLRAITVGERQSFSVLRTDPERPFRIFFTPGLATQDRVGGIGPSFAGGQHEGIIAICNRFRALVERLESR